MTGDATSQPPVTLTERLLAHDRAIILSAIVFIAVLAWWYLLTGAGTGMSPFAMSTWEFPSPIPAVVAPAVWAPGYALLMLLMWWVMMIAMMLPSAAPLILLYARVHRHGHAQGRIASSTVPAGAFAAGYLLCWLAFSGIATLLQFSLERSGFLDGMLMWSASPWLSAALLGIAGLYQLSPMKSVCLISCRSPSAWLARRWRPGSLGALRMGAEHGAYCTGCCWALMLLLFVGGVMNLVWIAGLSIVVLVEKIAPHGRRLAAALGALLIGAGVSIAAAQWPA